MKRLAMGTRRAVGKADGEREAKLQKRRQLVVKLIKSYRGKPARRRKRQGYEAAELKEIFERYCPT
jgi:hypothetical protein